MEPSTNSGNEHHTEIHMQSCVVERNNLTINTNDTIEIMSENNGHGNQVGILFYKGKGVQVCCDKPKSMLLELQ